MLPQTERKQLFVLLARNIFSPSDATYQEVFGHLAKEAFSVQEAAQYLEMSVPNFRRYVQSRKFHPCKTVGRNQFFATRDLKMFKRARQAEKSQ